jgi:hypothetical protein
MTNSPRAPSVSNSPLIVLGTLPKNTPCPLPPEPYARDHVAGGPATPARPSPGPRPGLPATSRATSAVAAPQRLASKEMETYTAPPSLALRRLIHESCHLRSCIF